MVVEDFDEAAFDVEDLFGAGFGVSEGAVAEDTEQGGVAREDTQVTVLTGQFGFGDLSVY